jgi:hypothetical protein
MAFLSDLFKRIFARSQAADYSALGCRLKQIEHDPNRHEYNYDVLDGMHNKQTSIRHARRAEHNSREFLCDKRAEHPDQLIEDRPLSLHDSARSDRLAARDYMIKDHTNDQLYNYTARMPIIHDDQA